MEWFITSFLAALTALLTVAAATFFLRTAILSWVVKRALVRTLKDRYPENLWDIAVGITRVPPHILMELDLRAEYGETLERPLGTIRRLADFSGVAFNPAQLITLPLGPQAEVDLSTVVGASARHALRLDMPIMISAMAFGVALSKPFVLALARGASQAGTAYNAGSGPLLDTVVQETKHLILQYTGLAYTRNPDVLAQADMIEVRYGHGARAAAGRIITAGELPQEARQMLGVPNNGEVIMDAPLPGAATPAELRKLVPELRHLIDGGPIAVKLAGTHDLERELAAVLEADVDVIVLDGCNGGTHSSPAVIADDFGIPTVWALHRAVRFLERCGARREVTLVAGGGLRTPGEFLKALALGADAVYVGTAAMMAGTHAQISKSAPLEPVTQICWATGQRADQFDTAKGAETVANFLKACSAELAEAARALGKGSIKEIGREDLIARDRDAAAFLGLPPGWRPPRRPGGQSRQKR